MAAPAPFVMLVTWTLFGEMGLLIREPFALNFCNPLYVECEAPVKFPLDRLTVIALLNV